MLRAHPCTAIPIPQSGSTETPPRPHRGQRDLPRVATRSGDDVPTGSNLQPPCSATTTSVDGKSTVTALLRPPPAAALPNDLTGLADAELRAAYVAWRAGQPLVARGHVSPVAAETALSFAAEALRRARGIQLYEEQLAAARAMAAGRLVELETGEGKTYVAAAAAVALLTSARSVHVITSNQYLALRDAGALAPVWECLGLRAAALPTGGSPELKRLAYSADVLYATVPELGFDFLRDELAEQRQPPLRLGRTLLGRLRGEDLSQRSGRVAPAGRPDVAVVDEADHVLLDEAASPLVLAERPDDFAPDAETLRAACRVAELLRPVADFLHDVATGAVRLTPEGRRVIARLAPEGGLFLRPWNDYVTNAIQAARLLRRDEHYLVVDTEIVLLDPGTGRRREGHRWQAGLHQAVLAKEGLPLTADVGSLLAITRPRLLARYRRLVGLTGTAAHAADEFRELYGLSVQVVSPHFPSRREILPQRLFAFRAAKEAAVVEEVCQRNAAGQPVLVGTRTIESTDRIALALRERGLAVEVLSGRDDAREAEIIARAGAPGAVTVATNLAGRGTDIRLSPEAVASGGLHVIAVERQQSPRIDRQLIGRSGRQGEPGSARTFVSAEDWLLTEFAPRLARWIVDQASPDGELSPDVARSLDRAIDAVQLRADGYLARRRRELFAEDRLRDGSNQTVGRG